MTHGLREGRQASAHSAGGQRWRQAAVAAAAVAKQRQQSNASRMRGSLFRHFFRCWGSLQRPALTALVYEHNGLGLGHAGRSPLSRNMASSYPALQHERSRLPRASRHRCCSAAAPLLPAVCLIAIRDAVITLQPSECISSLHRLLRCGAPPPIALNVFRRPSLRRVTISRSQPGLSNATGRHHTALQKRNPARTQCKQPSHRGRRGSEQPRSWMTAASPPPPAAAAAAAALPPSPPPLARGAPAGLLSKRRCPAAPCSRHAAAQRAGCPLP